jgi:hypothetical protein
VVARETLEAVVAAGYLLGGRFFFLLGRGRIAVKHIKA